MKGAVIGLLCLFAKASYADWRIDDDVLAHRLYTEGRYSEAAEIFTDPAWKGLALYRSDQWWRAAEAFVRADDALSAHNLGNSYVQLGYYALALEAYQRALSLQPTLEVAQHNADIMRQLLASDDSDQQQSGRRDRDQEIDRLERGQDDPSARDGAGGEQDNESPSNTTGEQEGEPNASPPSDGGDQPSDNNNDDSPANEDRQDAPGDPTSGQAQEQHTDATTTGTSEADTRREDADVLGLRATLESEQATEQWLNQIAHDPATYLQKRIALEIRRRQAAGQSAPAGGSNW